MRNQRRPRLSNPLLGLILVAVIAVASVLAFTKELPWGSKYTVQAVFTSASNVRFDSPVRIAGVEVGKVTKVEHLAAVEEDAFTAQAGGDPTEGASGDPEGAPQQATVVTMELEDSALPLHTDATMKLRPRLFLEGNLFVDLKPGSPNAEEAEDGYVFPASQTAIAVQLDQVLSTLQADVRSDLQTLLDQFGNALIKHGGAEGFRELYASSPRANRFTAQVNEAFLGNEPGDLSSLIVNLDSTFEALARNEVELQDLVTNLRIVTGSFAAQDEALERAIAELPRTLAAGGPAFDALNDSFPALRAFAREALPGVRSTPETLDAATPLLRQIRGLVSEDELRGLVADLRPTIPRLTKLARRTVPFLKESRKLSSCFNEVVIPWSQLTVNDPETEATGKVYEETGYGLVGIAGESRAGDANGQVIKVVAGGGTNTVVVPDTPTNPASPGTDGLISNPALEILGSIPDVDSAEKTPFRQDIRCETQEVPNLEAGDYGTAPGDASMGSASSSAAPKVTPEDEAAAEELGETIERATRLSESDSRSSQRRGAALQERASADLEELLADLYGLGGEFGGSEGGK